MAGVDVEIPEDQRERAFRELAFPNDVVLPAVPVAHGRSIREVRSHEMFVRPPLVSRLYELLNTDVSDLARSYFSKPGNSPADVTVSILALLGMIGIVVGAGAWWSKERPALWAGDCLEGLFPKISSVSNLTHGQVEELQRCVGVAMEDLFDGLGNGPTEDVCKKCNPNAVDGAVEECVVATLSQLRAKLASDTDSDGK